MPERFTFESFIFDRKCTKCNRTKEVHFFAFAMSIYKTCNARRFGAQQIRRARLPESDYDYDEVDAAFASASASASDYFVDEPYLNLSLIPKQ
jgi:hypothetical protein